PDVVTMMDAPTLEQCNKSTTRCGDTCADLTTDNSNCGSCGTQCPSKASCEAGSCVCNAGQQLCNGACTDTATDTTNCGACGKACITDETCTEGRCMLVCTLPKVVC